MIRPSLIEVKQFDAQRYRRVPISMEMYSDRMTPIGVLKTLREKSRHCFILESAEDSQRWGRYTFLGFNPTLGITCRDGKVKVNGREVENTARRNDGTTEPPRPSGIPPREGNVAQGTPPQEGNVAQANPSKLIQEMLK